MRQPVHFKKTLDNGVTREQIIEVNTHLARYSGWSTANTAVAIAHQVFEEVRQ